MEWVWTMILITYCPVVVSKENHSPSLVLETVRRLWYHKCTRNTFMGSFVAGTQAGATGIWNEGHPTGSLCILAFLVYSPRDPDPRPRNPQFCRVRTGHCRGHSLWESPHYNLMSMKLWLSLCFQFWYKFLHSQITDVNSYWWLQCFFFHSAPELSPPSTEKGDPER